MVHVDVYVTNETDGVWSSLVTSPVLHALNGTPCELIVQKKY